MLHDDGNSIYRFVFIFHVLFKIMMATWLIKLKVLCIQIFNNFKEYNKHKLTITVSISKLHRILSTGLSLINALLILHILELLKDFNSPCFIFLYEKQVCRDIRRSFVPSSYSASPHLQELQPFWRVWKCHL